MQVTSFWDGALRSESYADHIHFKAPCCHEECVPHLRKTHIYQIMFFQSRFWLTRNEHFQNGLSSRLRRTQLYLTKMRLVEITPHILYDVCIIKPNWVCHNNCNHCSKNITSSTSNAQFQKLLSKGLTSCTADGHFQNEVSPRLRETIIFFGKLCLVYVE